jgi:hypothetical protein
MDKKRIIILFCILAIIGYVKYSISKNTTYFSVDASRGSQIIYLDTETSPQDFVASVHCELKGEINKDIEVLLTRVNISLDESFVNGLPYNIRFKKGKIDTTFGGDWYTNNARLLLKFPPNCQGTLKGYIKISK